MDFNQLFNLPSGIAGADAGGGKKIGEVWRAFMEQLLANPQLWISAVQDGRQKQMEIMNQLQAQQPDPVVQPAKNDRRFQAEQWRNNPFFSFLMQNYLVNGDVFRRIVEQIDLPEKDKKILRFTVGQYIDAMSPANFPATNPEVMEQAVKTGGKSVADGMRNMMEDMKDGMVKNTDMSAFSIGEDVASAPGKVVLQTPVMQLIEYAPQTAKVYARPLLIIPPCINKFYILDLTEEKSFVRNAVAAGHRVFLVSWVNAGADIARLRWDDYLREGVMGALAAVSAISKQNKINTLGFCIGGTMLAAALAVLAENDEHPAQSVTLLATMLDFSDGGEIGLFIDEDSVAAREAQYANGGLMDGRELARGFAALRPNDLIWPYVIDNYYQGKKPPAFDLLFWNADSTNLPGPMFAEYLRKTYLENQLTRGTAIMCDTPVNLSAVRAPLYAVSCEKDHIVPWKAAYASAAAMNKKARFVLAASGHIAGIVNPPEKNKGWRLAGEIGGTKNADKWRESATRTDGSWWEDWLIWLAKSGGKQVAAPKRAGGVRYPPVEDAPGSYVKAPRPAISPDADAVHGV